MKYTPEESVLKYVFSRRQDAGLVARAVDPGVYVVAVEYRHCVTHESQLEGIAHADQKLR